MIILENSKKKVPQSNTCLVLLKNISKHIQFGVENFQEQQSLIETEVFFIKHLCNCECLRIQILNYKSFVRMHCYRSVRENDKVYKVAACSKWNLEDSKNSEIW